MTQISIPKPCHENWENMLPEAQGKHCLACSKTVIDFSTWEEDKILEYLQSNRQEKVCGRFNVTQLDRNSVLPFIIQSNVSMLKKIAAIVLLCFGMMAGQEAQAQKKSTPKVAICYQQKPDSTMVKGEATMIDDTKTQHPTTIDTARYQPQIMGMIAPPIQTTKKGKTPQSSSIKKQKNLKPTE